MMESKEYSIIERVENDEEIMIFEIKNYYLPENFIRENGKLESKIYTDIEEKKLIIEIKEKCNINLELENYEYIIFDIDVQNNFCNWKISFFKLDNPYVERWIKFIKNIANKIEEIYENIRWNKIANINLLNEEINNIKWHILDELNIWENYNKCENENEEIYIMQSRSECDIEENNSSWDFIQDLMDLLEKWFSHNKEYLYDSIEQLFEVLSEKIEKFFKENKEKNEKTLSYSQ